MFLSEITDALWAAGYTDDQVDAWRDKLYAEYPKLLEEAYSHAMSTNPHDPEVPDTWARKVMDEADAEFFSNPPVGLLTMEDERRALLAQVLKLLPTAKEDDASKKAYNDKITRISNRILTGKNIGFSIVHGNTKIGKIDNFSLPAGNNFRGASCPGATELCESKCYAKDALFSMNEWRYFTNWAYLLLWPERFADAWKTAKLTKVVRIHVGGDFFSPSYIQFWMGIIRSRPDVRFYAYTRSWQNGKGLPQQQFIGPLKELAALPNMRLILSCDNETGIPQETLIPGTFRAWLAIDNDDLPLDSKGNVVPLELLFRDRDGMHGQVLSVMGGTTVCPVERSSKHIKKSKVAVTCKNCGWCWSTGHKAFGVKDDNPEQFDKFIKKDMTMSTAARAAQMFRPFVPWAKKFTAPNPPRCSCGIKEPCSVCGSCAICSCGCGGV